MLKYTQTTTTKTNTYLNNDLNLSPRIPVLRTIKLNRLSAMSVCNRSSLSVYERAENAKTSEQHEAVRDEKREGEGERERETRTHMPLLIEMKRYQLFKRAIIG